MQIKSCARGEAWREHLCQRRWFLWRDYPACGIPPTNPFGLGAGSDKDLQGARF
jgi:hypothetical protein